MLDTTGRPRSTAAFLIIHERPIFEYWPVVFTRKQALYPCPTLPWAVVKTSGTQSYHMEEAGPLPVAQTLLEGTQWEKWERGDIFLSSSYHLFLVYHWSQCTPAGISEVFCIILELKHAPKPHLLPDSTDTKCYSQNPPANAGHRSPVACLSCMPQEPTVHVRPYESWCTEL